MVSKRVFNKACEKIYTRVSSDHCVLAGKSILPDDVLISMILVYLNVWRARPLVSLLLSVAFPHQPSNPLSHIHRDGIKVSYRGRGSSPFRIRSSIYHFFLSFSFFPSLTLPRLFRFSSLVRVIFIRRSTFQSLIPTCRFFVLPSIHLRNIPNSRTLCQAAAYIARLIMTGNTTFVQQHDKLSSQWSLCSKLA